MKITPPPSLLLASTSPSMEHTKTGEASFSQWLGGQITHFNDKLTAADEALTQLASGQTQELHQTMITLEEAKLSFQYVQQIRNRLMSAYQELMREQI